MEDRETARMRRYGESKMTWIMMATVPHVTSGLGLRKFQADGFLLTRVYNSVVRRDEMTGLNWLWKKFSCNHLNLLKMVINFRVPYNEETFSQEVFCSKTSVSYTYEFSLYILTNRFTVKSNLYLLCVCVCVCVCVNLSSMLYGRQYINLISYL